MTPRLAVMAWLLLGTQVAAADLLPARLHFTRDPALVACPDEPALRAAVAERLGADPFREDAGRDLEVTIQLHGAEIVAEIFMPQSGAHRTLRTANLSCAELAGALFLAVTLSVEPLWEAPTAPPTPPAPPSPPAPSPSSPSRPPPARRPNRFHLGIAGVATVAGSPELTIGVRLELGVRVGSFEVGVEPWLVLPASTAAPGGSISLGTEAISLVACHAVGPLSACAVAAGGAMQAVGHGGFLLVNQSSSPFVAAGARIYWETIVFSGMGLRLETEALVPIIRTVLEADTSQGPVEAWSTPWILPSFAIAVVGHLP